MFIYLRSKLVCPYPNNAVFSTSLEYCFIATVVMVTRLSSNGLHNNLRWHFKWATSICSMSLKQLMPKWWDCPVRDAIIHRAVTSHIGHIHLHWPHSSTLATYRFVSWTVEMIDIKYFCVKSQNKNSFCPILEDEPEELVRWKDGHLHHKYIYKYIKKIFEANVLV